MEIYCSFQIESARRLPNLPAEHPCHRVHGHGFRVEVHVRGPLDLRLGWVIDFGDIEQAFAPLREALDHRYLNDVPGLENPTSEIMAVWIWNRLKPVLPGLSKIVVRETDHSGCIYTGA